MKAAEFGELLVGNGGGKRNAWERSFGEVTRELGIGVAAGGSFVLVRSPVVPWVGPQRSNRLLRGRSHGALNQ
ncbi:MAG: hypothetical protein WAV20_12140 [Blastocatellia bacterium]